MCVEERTDPLLDDPQELVPNPLTNAHAPSLPRTAGGPARTPSAGGAQLVASPSNAVAGESWPSARAAAARPQRAPTTLPVPQ